MRRKLNKSQILLSPLKTSISQPFLNGFCQTQRHFFTGKSVLHSSFSTLVAEGLCQGENRIRRLTKIVSKILKKTCFRQAVRDGSNVAEGWEGPLEVPAQAESTPASLTAWVSRNIETFGQVHCSNVKSTFSGAQGGRGESKAALLGPLVMNWQVQEGWESKSNQAVRDESSCFK